MFRINTRFKLIDDIGTKLLIKKLNMKKINSMCNSKYYICIKKLKRRISFQCTIKRIINVIKSRIKKIKHNSVAC
jgi:hypothetical protein